MSSLAQKIWKLVVRKPGLTDLAIARKIRGPQSPQQPINQACRRLAKNGLLVRKKRLDGFIGNYPDAVVKREHDANTKVIKHHHGQALSEDKIKEVLELRLASQGWHTKVARGKKHGIDVDAKRENKRWIIEVKGPGSLPAMRVNYFIAILGETLQRMDDPLARYSICLPDMSQYRSLWKRLPTLAKKRTHISILFVSPEGVVEELD